MVFNNTTLVFQNGVSRFIIKKHHKAKEKNRIGSMWCYNKIWRSYESLQNVYAAFDKQSSSQLSGRKRLGDMKNLIDIDIS